MAKPSNELTPMQRQYNDIKEKNKDFGMGRGVSTLLSSPIKCIITQLFTENKIM